MASVQHILANKGWHVHTISPDATVLEATRLMNHHKIGALVVMADDRVAGIFTERDVLQRIVGQAICPADVSVGQVMTKQLICCEPTTELDEASRIMRDRRIRHLPVCDDAGRLLGLISIGDLNAYHVSMTEAQLSQLNNYVFGRS